MACGIGLWLQNSFFPTDIPKSNSKINCYANKTARSPEFRISIILKNTLGALAEGVPRVFMETVCNLVRFINLKGSRTEGKLIVAEGGRKQLKNTGSSVRIKAQSKQMPGPETIAEPPFRSILMKLKQKPLTLQNVYFFSQHKYFSLLTKCLCYNLTMRIFTNNKL